MLKTSDTRAPVRTVLESQPNFLIQPSRVADYWSIYCANFYLSFPKARLIAVFLDTYAANYLIG